jgi:uncharacterized integral membrane protein
VVFSGGYDTDFPSLASAAGIFIEVFIGVLAVVVVSHGYKPQLGVGTVGAELVGLVFAEVLALQHGFVNELEDLFAVAVVFHVHVVAANGVLLAEVVGALPVPVKSAAQRKCTHQ